MIHRVYRINFCTNLRNAETDPEGSITYIYSPVDKLSRAESGIICRQGCNILYERDCQTFLFPRSLEQKLIFHTRWCRNGTIEST